jgi:glycosyltransferase involved in cell wall biosynthesis
VIVNSSFHRDYARRFNSDVREIPSVVDGDRYFPASRGDPNGRVCIGWTGSASTASNLSVIEAPISELAQRPDVDLRFIGIREPPLNGLDAVIQPWRPETEVEDLRPLDVGLLPLPVTEWNKRKFYLKLVQYMALGIPAVCTPLGANPEVIDHGRTGFLADSDSEWTATLDRLVGDPSLRAEVGSRAAAVARQRYTLQANTERIVEAFRAALS